MQPSIYLDYNATTPLDTDVMAAMIPFLEGHFGNPSSVHHLGREARAMLDDCRYRLASLFGCKPSELIFTSGGTESNNLAIFSVARSLTHKGRHLITSAIEHHAVLHSFESLARDEGFDLTILPVSTDGIVDPDELASAIRPDTTLVSVMAANNEIGSVQPIEAISRICRDADVLFHTDAVQAFGKMPFSSFSQFNADLVSLCAHKFHGPKGVGLLYARSPLRLPSLFKGGAHENESRPGTENLLGIVGLTSACERFLRTPVFDPLRLGPLSQRLVSGLADLSAVQFLGPSSTVHQLANTVAFTVAGWDSISLLAALDLEGICASSGSACSVGSLEPSHVLLAMGRSAEEANSLVRFSLGRETTAEEIDSTIGVLQTLLALR